MAPVWHELRFVLALTTSAVALAPPVYWFLVNLLGGRVA